MLHLETLRALSPTDLAAARALAPRNDHLRADIDHGPRPGFVAVIARDRRGAPLGYAQASAGNGGFVIDAVVSTGYDGDPLATRADLLRTLLGELPGYDARHAGELSTVD